VVICVKDRHRDAVTVFSLSGFKLLFCKCDTLGSGMMNVHPIGIDTFPCGLHHTEQMLGGDILFAQGGPLFKIFV
jgi:hypothetical protein